MGFKKTLLAFAVLSIVSACSFGQVEVVKKKSLIGVTRPEIVGDRIFVGEDSNPTVADVAVVFVDPAYKFSLVKIRRDGERVEAEKLSDGRLILVGKGKYTIDATLFDPEKGIFNNEYSVELGGTSPKPPKPDDPIPPPAPVDDVPNEYNVGKISLKNAPSDTVLAKQIAGQYESAANLLVGLGGFATVETAIAGLDRQFELKQCRDAETCQKWAAWKSSVVAAMRAEQVRRGNFTRQDWFAMLNEVAAGLRAVK